MQHNGGGGSALSQSALGHLQEGPTAARPTYRLVQVLRAVAALMVVLHHAIITMHDRYGLAVLNWIQGGAGVDIFFVISGFVMTISAAPLLAAKHPARTFLARRLERIVPLYWLLTTVKVISVYLDPAVAINGLGSRWHVLASFLFLPALSGTGSGEPVLIVGWTLNIEMLFYALFAIALAMRVRPILFVTPVLSMVALLAWFHSPTLPTIFNFYLNPMVVEFLFGMLLAAFLPWLRKLPLAAAVVLFFCGAWVLHSAGWPNASLFRFVGWGIPAFAIVWSAVVLERRVGRWAPRWLLELGDASYSLYLVHGFVLPAFSVALVAALAQRPHGVLLTFSVMVLASVAVAEVLYRGVEQPIMQWFKGRRRTAVPALA